MLARLRIVPAALALTIAALGAFAPANAARAATAAGSQLPPQPTSRMVKIDGRFVKVTLSATTVIPGAPLEGGNKPSTSVSASISIQDGALLPEGLRAVRVRFEKFYGTNRVFLAPLTELQTAGSGVFELDAKDYRSDITGRIGGAKRLRATVILQQGDRVIRVPMGTIPVNLEPLP